MTGGLAHRVESSRAVVCVLADEQRAAYQSELSRLEREGIALSFEQSPEHALELITASAPELVVVGMSVGTMEGLEFLALMMSRARGFRGQVLVLPDKGDPFLPQLHSRDPATGKSSTQPVELSAIEALFASIAETPEVSPPPAAPVPARAPVAQPPAPASALVLAEPSPASVPARRPRSVQWVLLAGLGVAGFVVLALVGLRGRTVETSSSARGAAPVSAPAGATPVAPSVAPSVSAAPTALAAAPDLTRPTALPLTFPKRGSDFSVTNERELDAMVAAISRALEQEPQKRLEVGGHTSAEGAPGFNFELGKRRAAIIERYLSGRGIPRSRIMVRSHGASQPLAGSGAEADANRRVTVRLRD